MFIIFTNNFYRNPNRSTNEATNWTLCVCTRSPLCTDNSVICVVESYLNYVHTRQTLWNWDMHDSSAAQNHDNTENTCSERYHGNGYDSHPPR